MNSAVTEAVARAIHADILAVEREEGGDGAEWEEMTDPQRQLITRLATAAILAMSNQQSGAFAVTEAMRDAGVEYWHESEDTMLLDDLVSGLYLAMSEAAGPRVGEVREHIAQCLRLADRGDISEGGKIAFIALELRKAADLLDSLGDVKG